MGAKISLERATLMSKGLELIEAHHLFGLPADRIEILIYPQIRLFTPWSSSSTAPCSRNSAARTVRVPIAYALAWP